MNHTYMTKLEQMKRSVCAGLDNSEIAKLCEVSELMVARTRELCEASGVEIRPSDTEMINWLQQGHCVLALCVFDDNKKLIGTSFEIDGFQDCAVDSDLRKAIAKGMLLEKQV